MPKKSISGVTLAYELLGDGPTIVWTPGGWFPRNDWSYLNAGCFSSRYQNLLWDRRNCGASDIAIEDAPTEFHLWADDLHGLLQELNTGPVYLAGGSNGTAFSLMMAHLYPQDVKGLILTHPATDDIDLLNRIIGTHYHKIADVAENKDMQAVIAYSTEAWIRIVSGQSIPEDFDWLLNWVAETISLNPENRGRLLSMAPKAFAKIMRKWGDLVFSGRAHFAGLSDQEIRQISVPAIVVPGFDDIHPRHTAENLHTLLPNSTWVEYTEKYSQEKIDQVRQSDVMGREKTMLTMPFLNDFLETNR